MIAYDFEYYRPTSIEEATQLYQSLDTQGKQPIYYAGGTEIITLGRVNQITTEAVIDIKGIQECHLLELQQNQLLMGAALPFTILQEKNPFPLLSQTIGEVADHTARNKITLGGNICGSIVFREAVLPLLVTDSQVVIATQTGMKQVPIQHIFNKHLQLEKGEFLLQVMTDESYLQLPYFKVKKRRQWKVGYPLITVAAIKKRDQIKVAFSGVCPFPFRDEMVEQSLNEKTLAPEIRVDNAIQHLPQPILDDVEGSAEYRLFVLKNTLLDMLKALEGDENVQI